MNKSGITPASRRSFLKTVGAAAGYVTLSGLSQSGALAADAPGKKIKLGFDNFSVRAMGWKALALLDYAAALRLDAILISDLDAYESLEEPYLKRVRAKAEELGIQIHAGTWSICPGSRAFKNKWGTAEEHLALGIRVAKALGSPVIRCVLGGREDRNTEGGIEARMAETAKVCKACRSRAIDAAVKIAIENHAGDMQAPELVSLVEAAGKDYVGVTLDSGNATWTMEDPLESLERLGPYALSTGMRDSVVWESEEGAKVQWTAMGEGQVDWKRYFERYAAICPQVPVNIEVISGFAYSVPYLKPEFWRAYPNLKAAEFVKFLKMAKAGKPLPSHKSPDQQAEQEYQKGELEQSVKYCREVLGLGQKPA